MDPSFTSFFFVSDRSYLEAQKKKVRKGLHILVGDIIEQLHSSHSSQHVSSTSPPSKRLKDDPFADFRNKTGAPNASNSDRSASVKELDRQIRIYENMDIDDDYDNNPFTFWYKYKTDLPLLAKIAKSVLVIPASSAAGERHFSIIGQIVTELRSSLDPDCLEALVVLKEAYLNQMWPNNPQSDEQSEQNVTSNIGIKLTIFC